MLPNERTRLVRPGVDHFGSGAMTKETGRATLRISASFGSSFSGGCVVILSFPLRELLGSASHLKLHADDSHPGRKARCGNVPFFRCSACICANEPEPRLLGRHPDHSELFGDGAWAVSQRRINERIGRSARLAEMLLERVAAAAASNSPATVVACCCWHFSQGIRAGRGLTTQAQRPGPRDAWTATVMRWPGSLQRMVRPTGHADAFLLWMIISLPSGSRTMAKRQTGVSAISRRNVTPSL